DGGHGEDARVAPPLEVDEAERLAARRAVARPEAGEVALLVGEADGVARRASPARRREQHHDQHRGQAASRADVGCGPYSPFPCVAGSLSGSRPPALRWTASRMRPARAIMAAPVTTSIAGPTASERSRAVTSGPRRPGSAARRRCPSPPPSPRTKPTAAPVATVAHGRPPR